MNLVWDICCSIKLETVLSQVCLFIVSLRERSATLPIKLLLLESTTTGLPNCPRSVPILFIVFVYLFTCLFVCLFTVWHSDLKMNLLLCWGSQLLLSGLFLQRLTWLIQFMYSQDSRPLLLSLPRNTYTIRRRCDTFYSSVIEHSIIFLFAVNSPWQPERDGGIWNKHKAKLITWDRSKSSDRKNTHTEQGNSTNNDHSVNTVFVVIVIVYFIQHISLTELASWSSSPTQSYPTESLECKKTTNLFLSSPLTPLRNFNIG